MEYFFSLLERKSFVKIISLCLVSFIFLTGFTFSSETKEGVIVNPLLNETQGENIQIFPPKRVSLIYADERIEILTYEENVREVLGSYDFNYCEINDIVHPNLDSGIKNNTLIRIVIVEKDFVEKFKEIAFKTVRIKDANLTAGKEILEQEGKVGEGKLTYQQIFENDILIETKLHKTEIIKQPVNQIIKVGTKNSAMGVSNCEHWFNVVDKNTRDEAERNILKSLIRCESGCNDGRNNRNKYLGLLQFNQNTFNHYGNGDIWNGEQQIVAALKIIRSGGLSHHWPACSKDIN